MRRSQTVFLVRCIVIRYSVLVIRSFACKETEKLWLTGKTVRWSAIQRAALKKLALLAAVTRLDELKVPPGNRLEALRGSRAGSHSIRINDQWRLCFRWEETGPIEVEIVDYH